MGGIVCLVILFASSLAAGASAGDAVAVNPADEDKVADCIGLGFTGLNRCSDCDSLQDFTKNEAISAECKKCCAKDSTKVIATFDEARLEVCKRKLSRYPDVSDFIDKHAKKLKPRGKEGETTRRSQVLFYPSS